MIERLMSWLRGVPVALRAGAFDREMEEELQFHLDSQIAANIASGMSESDARAAALKQLGQPMRISERARAEHAPRRLLDAVRQDALFALRSYARAPVLTFVAIMTIAIGVGAVTAIFTLVNVMLLRPLPFVEGDRLVLLFVTAQGGRIQGVDTAHFEFGKLRQLSGRIPALESVAFGSWDDLNLDTGTGIERIRVGAVSDNFFATLGVAPEHGAVFQPGSANEVVISHAMWRSRFGESRSIVDKVVRISGAPLTVVGVMPRGFTGVGDGAEMWLPMRALTALPGGSSERHSSDGDYAWGPMFGRIRPGATVEVVGQQLAALMKQLPPERAPPGWRIGYGAISFAKARQHPLIRPVLGILSATVALVLLIVCANVAGLTLVRVRSRESELAVRRAIGASRGRIARQLVVEGVVLALLGALPGVFLAYAGATILAQLRPKLPQNWSLLRSTDLLADVSVRPDANVLLFALAVVLTVGVCAGVAGFLAASGDDLETPLRRSAQRIAGVRAARRHVLVVLQIALATALVIAASLINRSVSQLTDTPAGYDPDHLAVLHLAGDREGVLIKHLGDIVAAVSTRPGVRKVATETCPPFDFMRCILMAAVDVDGVPRPLAAAQRMIVHRVSDDYFAALGMRVVRGRTFTGDDRPGTMTAVVINETAANAIWPKGNAVGHTMGDPPTVPDPTVIGVVEDSRYFHLDRQPEAQVYIAERQTGSMQWWDPPQAVLFIRTTGSPESVIPGVRRAIAAVAPGVAVYDASTMHGLIMNEAATTRFIAMLLSAFAAIAALLSAMGVYGMLAYQVAQQRRELGVRAALGAAPLTLVRYTGTQVLLLVLVGVLAGIFVAIVATPLLDRFLFHVPPTDAGSYAAAVVLIVVVGMLAALIPVRQAMRADPSIALRE
jgi:putative ABC transport system permease protein